MLSLTYVSSATELLDEPRLVAMLEAIRPRNRANGLTGLLLYRDGNIIQTLEGPEVAVDETFGRIARDGRHRGLIVLLRERVERRQFGDWAMAFHSVGAGSGRPPEGWSDFLREGWAGAPEADSPAWHMLEAFRRTVR